MKLPTLLLLLCAMIALGRAARANFVAKRETSCPDNWTKIKSRCFAYVLTPMTWSDAQHNCRTMGAHLASVHSAQEYQDIQSLIWSITHDYQETWIGGCDTTKEGAWSWTDGTYLNFQNWCPGEPNDGGKNQDCLQINYSEKRCWDDETCSVKLPSVCAK